MDGSQWLEKNGTFFSSILLAKIGKLFPPFYNRQKKLTQRTHRKRQVEGESVLLNLKCKQTFTTFLKIFWIRRSNFDEGFFFFCKILHSAFNGFFRLPDASAIFRMLTLFFLNQKINKKYLTLLLGNALGFRNFTFVALLFQESRSPTCWR